MSASAQASTSAPTEDYSTALAIPIPVVEPPPKAKRGRKPNPAGLKSAREALRKESHSRIEKRRREKINETLTTLRELIDEEENGARQQHSPPPRPEKEFKLELLERTVVFVRGLLDKTRRLEQELQELKGAPTGESESGSPRKRRRVATPMSSPQAGPSRAVGSLMADDERSVLSEFGSPPFLAADQTETGSTQLFPSLAPRRSMSIAALLSPSVEPTLPSPPPSEHKGPSHASKPQIESLNLP